MKVIFMPNNTASLASVHIKELRKLGVDAVGYNLTPKKQTSLDSIKSMPTKGLGRRVHFFYCFLKDLLSSDVIHWMYGGQSLSTKLLLALVAPMKKKKFVEYCGSDIRSLEMLCEDVPGYTVQQFIDEGLESLGLLNKSLATQRRFKKAGFVAMVSYPELVEYVNSEINPKFHLISRSVDLEKLNPDPKSSNKVPLIVHGPSNPKVKGTKYVIDALDRLKAEGKAEYKLLQNMPHAELLEYLNRADIVIDQVVAGDYGVFAIEAMALGKPVVCFIRPKVEAYYEEHYENFPIVNADRHNLYEVLEKLCSSTDLGKIGERGLEFARKYHDARINAKNLQRIYEDGYFTA